MIHFRIEFLCVLMAVCFVNVFPVLGVCFCHGKRCLEIVCNASCQILTHELIAHPVAVKLFHGKDCQCFQYNKQHGGQNIDINMCFDRHFQWMEQIHSIKIRRYGIDFSVADIIGCTESLLRSR